MLFFVGLVAYIFVASAFYGFYKIINPSQDPTGVAIGWPFFVTVSLLACMWIIFYKIIIDPGLFVGQKIARRLG